MVQGKDLYSAATTKPKWQASSARTTWTLWQQQHQSVGPREGRRRSNNARERGCPASPADVGALSFLDMGCWRGSADGQIICVAGLSTLPFRHAGVPHGLLVWFGGNRAHPRPPQARRKICARGLTWSATSPDPKSPRIRPRWMTYENNTPPPPPPHRWMPPLTHPAQSTRTTTGPQRWHQ